jgi:hypothetical protein
MVSRQSVDGQANTQRISVHTNARLARALTAKILSIPHRSKLFSKSRLHLAGLVDFLGQYDIDNIDSRIQVGNTFFEPRTNIGVVIRVKPYTRRL